MQFGNTPSDDALELVMESLRWSPHPESVEAHLDSLIVGQSYKLQLLFYEECCSRGFDVFVDGVQIADEFSPQAVQGGIRAAGSGAFISHTFAASRADVVVTLSGADADFPDRNPILQALTLEALTCRAAAELTLAPEMLTFSNRDWNVVQTVNVTAVDNAVDQGPWTPGTGRGPLECWVDAKE